MPFSSERGFVTFILVFLLLVGLATGVFLVQQRTSFLPSAKVDQTSSTQIKRDPLLGVRVSESAYVDQAVLLGVSKIRVSIESGDAFYQQTDAQKKFFEPLSQIITTAKNNNIQLIILIKPGSPVEKVDLENRIGLLEQTLGNYSNVVFELGNEPNGRNASGDPFWTGDYDSFANFIADSSSIIRQKWPSSPIIIGALDLQGKISGSNEDAAKADLNAYLDALAKKVALANFDFAFHSYHNVEWFNKIYTVQKTELSKRGIQPKLWLTETGITPSSGDSTQNLLDIIQQAEAKNDIRGVIVHSLDSKDGFQLWDSSNNKATESYSVLKSFIANNPKSVTATIQTKGSNASLISATDKSCANNPIAPPSANLVWHAFCDANSYASGHFSCSSNADCPQNTVQTGSGITASTSNQCVQFKEGARCIQLRLLKSENGQNLYDPKDPAFDTPNDTYVSNPANIPFGQVGIGQSPGKAGDNAGTRSDFGLFIKSYEQKIARIKEDQRVQELLSQNEVDRQSQLLIEAEKATQEAKDAQEAWTKDKENQELAKKASDATKKAADAVAAAEAIRKLAKLEEMLQGKTTEQCVKADLGIRPWLNARRIKARGEDTREDGSAGEKVNRYSRLYVCSGKDSKLKWRVATEGNDNVAGEANENSMERILRLHGDSEDAPYSTPKYPFTEVQGGYVTLVGQTVDDVRTSLEKYINAAKAGKAVIE